MCGIVGVITAAMNGFAHDELQAFKDLLVVDTLRGYDSTGVFGVSNRGNVGILKAAITGPQFVNTTEYDNFTKDLYREGQFLVGHNRWATRGSVSDKNAHPFWVDDKIVLVQNGTYKGSHKHHKDTEVDTEAIAHVISENADVEKALKKINAAYALVWYNTENHTLHMIRNSERPLYHVDTKAGAVMFASEMEFLMLAASRNKIGLKELPSLIEEDTLYTYELDKEAVWNYNEKKLDCSYVYDYKHDSTNFFPTGRWQPAKQPTRNTPFAFDLSEDEQQAFEDQNNNKSMTSTAYAAVYMGKFKEFNVTETESKALTDEISMMYNRKHMVEWFDYAPGNTHKDCQVWHIYGRILEAEETDNPRVLYHMTKWGKPEEEIVAMMLKGIYTVSVRTPVTNIVTKHNGDKDRVVTVLMYDEHLVNVYEPIHGIQ